MKNIFLIMLGVIFLVLAPAWLCCYLSSVLPEWTILALIVTAITPGITFCMCVASLPEDEKGEKK